jgi:OOP family OmpA-OmpF porin
VNPEKPILPLAFALLFSAALGLAAQAQTFKLDGHQLVLPAPITFRTGTAELDEAASRDSLVLIKAYLTVKSYISKLRVEGHTDNGGESAANQKLSEKRALAVCQWLKAQGVDCKRLLAVGFGNTKPVAASSSPEGRAQNRRITVVNAELRGRAIGGLPVDGGGKVAGEVRE